MTAVGIDSVVCSSDLFIYLFILFLYAYLLGSGQTTYKDFSQRAGAKGNEMTRSQIVGIKSQQVDK